MFEHSVARAFVLGALSIVWTGCSDGHSGAGGESYARSTEALSGPGPGMVNVCFAGQRLSLRPADALVLLRNGGSIGECEIMENRASLGDGYVETVYRATPAGVPLMIGVVVTESAMNSLPTDPKNEGATCFDLNGDNIIDIVKECAGGYERQLMFPMLNGLPFGWLMFNWQPFGHGPVGVFDKAHFDLHYFIQSMEGMNMEQTGPCGSFINCYDYQLAMIDVPAPFWPPGFSNIKGIQGRMGNHLVNTSKPPFDGTPLTRAFAYGQYDGHITFWEPVIGTEWLNTKPNDCQEIVQQPAVEVSGYYPRRYCTRYRPERQDFLMTLEGFRYRDALVLDGGAEPDAAMDMDGMAMPGAAGDAGTTGTMADGGMY